jgi:SAM-dependent methyltransferase
MMTASEIEAKYDAFYRKRAAEKVYPVEFVVRAFLGTYPRLKIDAEALHGRKVLDLGFGDGRNVPLLSDLGLDVHGVEITEEICRRATIRMKKLGVYFEARVGRNADLPYADSFFDHVVACHSCYYVDAGTKFADNIGEIGRVTKPGGLFVHSLPIGSSYIFRGATDLGDGHMRIANDPYGIRNGYVLKKFDAPDEIERALSPMFPDVCIGSCRSDWWGIEEHVWIVVGRRR